MCERWKKRSEDFNAEMEELLQNEKLQEEALHEEKERIKEQKRIKERYQEEISSCQTHLYNGIAEDSMKKDKCDSLLLPAINIPAASATHYKHYGVKGIDRVIFASAIKKEQEKTHKALEDAIFYRNLAERLRKEKRQAVSNMNDKVELVRDFWRNTILEGSTRGGRMVKKALETFTSH